MDALLLHLPVLPVLLPALTAIVQLWLGADAGQRGELRLRMARWIGLLSLLAGAFLSFWLVQITDRGDILVYRVGDWPAPYGIALVIDRLSALMLALTSAVAVPVFWYATGGWDVRGRHFHALFQWQVMGLAGAFVTGDVFNLFVFFEVLLMASYALMVHGQGERRLRAGLHYVVLNLAASAFFLVGVSLLYGVTGTLNLADLALRMPEIHGSQALMAQVAGMILLVVFGFKAALLPLSLWLPATYARSGAPVAALFAIMTKVGVYAILRVHGVVFGPAAGESAFAVEAWLLPLALGTSVLGALGALSARSMPRLVAWLTLSSAGTLMAAFGIFSPPAWSAGLYYLIHSTLVVAALFLLIELVAAQRGEVGDRLEPGSPMAQPALLGLLMLLASASVVGLPPMPGFMGKIMLLQASAAHPHRVIVWSVVLVVGFMCLIALARAGSLLFWTVRRDLPAAPAGASPRLVLATVSLLLMGVLVSVLASPLKRYTDAAAYQLHDLQAYGRAVLGLDPDTGEVLRPVRPYRAHPVPLRAEGEGS